MLAVVHLEGHVGGGRCVIEARSAGLHDGEAARGSHVQALLGVGFVKLFVVKGVRLPWEQEGGHVPSGRFLLAASLVLLFEFGPTGAEIRGAVLGLSIDICLTGSISEFLLDILTDLVLGGTSELLAQLLIDVLGPLRRLLLLGLLGH